MAQPRTSTTFGVTNDANRAQTAEETGLTRDQMKDLDVAWVVAFPQTPTMRSQPVIVGDTLFIAATDAGRLYALDTNSGCVKWHYVSDMTLRSSLTFAEATDNSPAAIIMGDAAGFVHAVDAKTGRKLWVSNARLNEYNRITGAPVVHDGKVITPVSAIEVNYAGAGRLRMLQGPGRRHRVRSCNRQEALDRHDDGACATHAPRPHRHAAMGAVRRDHLVDAGDRREAQRRLCRHGRERVVARDRHIRRHHRL